MILLGKAKHRVSPPAARGANVAPPSPRIGRLHRFDASATYLCTTPRTDVCGLAPHGAGDLASDSLGGLITLGPDGSRGLGSHALPFDNHIVTLCGPQGGRPLHAAAPLVDYLATQSQAHSLASSGKGGEVAIPSLRGGRLHRFDARDTFPGATSRADLCGPAPDGAGDLASDGLGGVTL